MFVLCREIPSSWSRIGRLLCTAFYLVREERIITVQAASKLGWIRLPEAQNCIIANSILKMTGLGRAEKLHLGVLAAAPCFPDVSRRKTNHRNVSHAKHIESQEGKGFLESIMEGGMK